MMKPISRLLRCGGMLVLLGVMLHFSRAAGAQEELSFVYGTNHFNGAAYSSTFVPPAVDTFYLIADQPSMVASRMTRVYYWPLTNEEKPDWDQANIVVDGQLEVLEDNRLVSTVEMTSYVIQYDNLDKFGTIRLYLGDEAVAARQTFDALQVQYREDLFKYYEAMEVYRQEFQAALAELQAGTITEDQMPEPPEPQKDLSLFSTNLLVGFPLDLAEGDYTIQLRLPDGSIQADSRKKLVVFSPLQEGIGYNVITEERWSAPEISQEENQIIYSVPGKRVYLEPYYQTQFNEQYYTRLNNPQDTQARRDRNVWVPFQMIEPGHLLTRVDPVKSVELELKDFHVNQIAGSALGYEIVERLPESGYETTFRAFVIEVDQPEIHILIKDSQGNVLPYSERELRVLNTANAVWIYALSALPLAGGLVAILLRKRSVKEINTQDHYS